VTDALVKALPGALDVAQAVHDGSRVHTFTSDAKTLHDRAAGVACQARDDPVATDPLGRPEAAVQPTVTVDYRHRQSQRADRRRDVVADRGLCSSMTHQHEDLRPNLSQLS
jgi:hypothetical protein